MQWLDGMVFIWPLACQRLDVMNIVPLQSDKLWRKALDTSQFCFWSRVFAADLLSWWVDAMTRWHGVYLATSMSTTRCDEHCAAPVWQIVKKSTRYQPVLLTCCPFEHVLFFFRSAFCLLFLLTNLIVFAGKPGWVRSSFAGEVLGFAIFPGNDPNSIQLVAFAMQSSKDCQSEKLKRHLT